MRPKSKDFANFSQNKFFANAHCFRRRIAGASKNFFKNTAICTDNSTSKIQHISKSFSQMRSVFAFELPANCEIFFGKTVICAGDSMSKIQRISKTFRKCGVFAFESPAQMRNIFRKYGDLRRRFDIENTAHFEKFFANMQ